MTLELVEAFAPTRAAPTSALAFDPSGEVLAIGHEDGTVCLWEPGSGQHRTLHVARRAGVNAVAFAPDDGTLAVGDEGGRVSLWDTGTGRLQASWHGCTGAVNTVAFAPSDDLIAVGGGRYLHPGELALWRRSTGQLLRTLTGHGNEVLSVAFAPQEHLLASCCFGGRVCLWDADRGECLRDEQAHHGAAWSLAFAPDGASLVSAGEDGLVLRPAHPGEASRTRSWSAFGLLAVAYTPDGKGLLTGSFDGGLCHWCAIHGTLRGAHPAHPHAVTCLALAARAGWVASGSSVGSVKLWKLRLPAPAPAARSGELHALSAEVLVG